MTRRSLAASRPTSPAAPAALVLALAAALGCATAPPPTPTTPTPSHTAAPLPPDAALVCGPGSRTIAWRDLGVPPQARPLDLALAADAVWVVFEPSFVVRVPRRPGAEEDRGFVSPNQEGERWHAVDVDPEDGSLWLARRDAYEMVQLVGSSARRVRLERVTGEGGLVELVAGPRALHVTPFCADHALWSFDRQGEMLAASFELPQDLGLDVDTSRTVNLAHACTRVHLARDEAGAVLAFHPVDVRLHRATADGWEAIGGPFDLVPPDRYTAGYRVAGLGPGEAGRYAPDLVRGLALLGGRPTLLGSQVTAAATGRTIGTLLYRLDGDHLSPVVEHCGGELLLDLESDAAGHAAVTAAGLILGPDG